MRIEPNMALLVEIVKRKISKEQGSPPSYGLQKSLVGVKICHKLVRQSKKRIIMENRQWKDMQILE
uniref:Uncharacterized protein n=1 Tax=Nelumbo nucifera TaxID=4432 RepID=A0A822Y9G2_NELNU|nr:TPA_asm: hypothetical protein HUJ06_029377 [Nelumbo nucifera]